MKYSITILCAALLCAALALAGCNNILTTSGSSPNTIKESGVKITVSGDQANPRTLFPTAHFFKYKLSFSGPVSHDDIFLEDGETSALVNDLANGNWTITATGYVMINGTEYPAAEGNKHITVTSGPLQSVNIPISAKQDGAQGYFSYTVSFPSSRVNDAYLEIYPLYGGGGSSYNLYDYPSGLLPLNPGYYRMSIHLYNGYETAGLTEVVHIYAHMETQAHYTFTDADFTDFITLRGTIDVKVDGQVPDYTYLQVYLDENYNNYLTDTWINMSNGTWSMRLPASDTEIPLYFRVAAHYNNGGFYRGIGMGTQVKDKDISDITFAPVNFNVVTVSGTVDIQVTGATLTSASINVYAGNGSDHFYHHLANLSVNPAGAWSWKTEPFDNAVNLYFRIEASFNDSGWFSQDLDKSITVKDQDEHIVLGTVSFRFVTLSGVINVTYDGGEQPHHVSIMAVDQNGNIWETGLWQPGADEPWSIILPSSDTSRNIRFSVTGYDNNWQRIFCAYANNLPLAVANVSVSEIALNLDIPPPDTPYNPVPLTEADWAKGHIDVSYMLDWYSIDVSAGTTYYIWFNRNNSGDGSQSLSGEIYVIYDDGREIINTGSAWDYPVSFTADSSGKVCIRVRGRWWESYTGTYELIYSTAANRPVRGVTNYVVTFNSMGGNAVNGGAVPSRNVASGAQVSKPADPVKSGFRFGGWYKEAALTNPWNFTADTVSGPVTLYAKWDVITYTVTFNANGATGGTAPGAQTVNANSSIALPGDNGLSKTGYTFGGWNTNSAGTGTNYSAGASYTVTGAATLYAKWNIITYTVTFNANGATGGTAPDAQTANAGSSITLPGDSGLSKSGYNFGGWNANAEGTGTNYNAGDSYAVNATVTLYAKWNAPGSQYTVTFDGNGADSGTAPAEQTAEAGSNITLPAGSGLGKIGYTFGGWNTDASGAGTNYNAGASYAVNATVTLYAKWNLIRYTVTFSRNGGSGTTPAAQTAEAGSSITLPPVSGFYREGYNFGGWNTNAQGTGTNYDAGASYTVTGAATLYAKWDAIPPAVYYTVSFNTDGGSAVKSQTVLSGDKASEPATPTKTGFTFGGWYKESSLTNVWVFTADTVSGNTPLYAKWNEADPGTISVTFTGFGDEAIDLTADTLSSISRSQSQRLTITINGEYDGSYQVYIDGSSRWWTSGNTISLYARDFSVGIHTLSVRVNNSGIPYSKKVTFRVVY